MNTYYRGELTAEQMNLYGYTYKLCLFCGEDTLIPQQTVSDVICESCGNWQNDYESEATNA